jgi:mercuric reductase
VAGDAIRPGVVLIATGAAAAVPQIPGLAGAGYLTSTTARDLTAVPDQLAVIGANAVGRELGQFFGHLGSAVTFLKAADRIAPCEEPEVSEALAGVLGGQGATVYAPAQVLSVKRDAGSRRIRATVNGTDAEIGADEILVATGRRPATAGLGLEAAGVATDARGAVVVDERLRTTNPGCWRPEVLSARPGSSTSPPTTARWRLAMPCSARTGRMTWRACRESSSPARGRRRRAHRGAGLRGRVPGDHIGPARRRRRAQGRVDRDTGGVTKLVADPATGALLGASIVGGGAGGLIQSAVLAIRHHITAAALPATVHPYLTMAGSLKLAAQAFTRDVARLSCCDA